MSKKKKFKNKQERASFLKNIHLFIWLHQVLAAACELLVAAYGI